MRCCGALEFDPVSSTQRSVASLGSKQFRLRGGRISLAVLPISQFVEKVGDVRGQD